MKMVHFCLLGLITLILASWNAGQAQDSLGMRCLSGLSYWYSAESIQMVGDLAYVVAGASGLYIISLADPANPVEIGRFTWYQWYGATGGAYVLGNRVYLGLYYGGFVLDVSDPTHPVVLGQWTDLGSGGISFVHDGWAIGQDTEGMPYVFDISNPANVHQIGVIPHSGPQRGIGMAGEYLCMTGCPGGLVLFDMSNPAEPQWVASIDTALSAHYATISGNYGYVATLDSGLRIIDLSNPLQPVEVAVCDTFGNTWDVTVTGNYAVTTKYIFLGSDDWLNVWNVTDPTHPVLESSIHPEALASSIISSSGNLVCTPMMGYDNSIMVVDISNPAAPVVASSFGPYGLLTRMAISGTTAYLADRVTGLRTVDLTDPYHVSELAHLNANGVEGFDVAVRGNYAYLVAPLLVVIDVSNPAQPESLGCEFPQGGYKIVIADDYAYVAGLHYLYTFSLENPAIPQCVDCLDLSNTSSYFGMAALNGNLYYACGSYLRVFSLSNPAAPDLMATCNLGGGNWVPDLAAAGEYVYLAEGNGGVQIIRLIGSGYPTLFSRIDGYYVQSVAAAGNIMIMDDGTRISIYDMTDPMNPALVGYYTTYEQITDMEIQGQYLFTTSLAEFRVYECDALSATQPHPEIIPHEFTLLPPYPNPFNSTLAIPFTLPIQCEATITIFNILGQQVHQFAFHPLYPGSHRVVWDAASCASGVYIIQLISNNQEFNRKALLLK